MPGPDRRGRAHDVDPGAARDRGRLPQDAARDAPVRAGRRRAVGRPEYRSRSSTTRGRRSRHPRRRRRIGFTGPVVRSPCADGSVQDVGVGVPSSRRPRGSGARGPPRTAPSAASRPSALSRPRRRRAGWLDSRRDRAEGHAHGGECRAVREPAGRPVVVTESDVPAGQPQAGVRRVQVRTWCSRTSGWRTWCCPSCGTAWSGPTPSASGPTTLAALHEPGRRPSSRKPRRIRTGS